MARINIQDDIESRHEFWKLMEIFKDRDLCLGKLVRFFRLAQHRYGHEQPLTSNDLSVHGLEAMIETGWALPAGNEEFIALGAAKQFEWYRQKVLAGHRSKEKAAEKRESNKNNDVATTEHQSRGNVLDITSPPLSPSLSPSLSKKEKLLGGTNEIAAMNYPKELMRYAELFATRKIQPKLVRLWLESYSSEFILEKIAGLLIWEQTAGAKGRKKEWGRFYSNCFKHDWDRWIAKSPNKTTRSAPSGGQHAQTVHYAPATNWVQQLFPKGDE